MYSSAPCLGLFALVALSVLLPAHAQTYTATYNPTSLPDQTENGQTGTNNCGTGSSQNSTCQNLYINSLEDFCLWGPPEPGPNSVIGNTEAIVVSYCIKSGYGTRLIPAGSITGAHFVQTPDYVQITGVGDLTSLNIPAGDAGGELDPHGATGNGNPVGGLVFSSAFNNGQLQQLHEWTNFMSASEFCIRACKEEAQGPALCNHIYDVMGCAWNMPGNYSSGVFESCLGDSGTPMGVYGGSTFHQGDPVTPPAQPAPSSSSCQTVTGLGGLVVTSSSVKPSATSAYTVLVRPARTQSWISQVYLFL
ncbi:hypothetical protein BJ322DRAFT_1002473 [Thelephora terrestris]|uniref:Uncharacterized protein n=1 Tax=Thelephora terrestris TaxID=56493 RepID=A0A9P6HJA7_9AGAM|nr:hypothetical protein BJ322DRAFT_1002473 [Thelephora terrestris]